MFICFAYLNWVKPDVKSWTWIYEYTCLSLLWTSYPTVMFRIDVCICVFFKLTSCCLWCLHVYFHTIWDVYSYSDTIELCETISESPRRKLQTGRIGKEKGREGSRNGECQRNQPYEKECEIGDKLEFSLAWEIELSSYIGSDSVVNLRPRGSMPCDRSASNWDMFCSVKAPQWMWIWNTMVCLLIIRLQNCWVGQLVYLYISDRLLLEPTKSRPNSTDVSLLNRQINQSINHGER